ncbi:hypothetical protein ACWOFR_07425 [Carnobacterium gallinarum]|uniref:hypothetical protein n=1 Tax=Carnobacterium gallinarum TaxID=2749 RepID=UPI0005568607|nr:hypothetical protein [Carnobacterium gallinarum]
MQLYLVLTATSSLLSKTIKLYTKASYNHASIALTPNLDDLSSFGRKEMHNPFIGGFVTEDISHEFFLNARCTIYSCELSFEEYHQIKEQLDYFHQNKEQLRYNLLGLIALAVKIDYQRNHAFFCSEFIATILTDSGVYQFSKKPHMVTPQDLQNLKIFTHIYTGTISNYLLQIQKVKKPLIYEYA